MNFPVEMDFPTAVKAGFTKYFNFSERASVSECGNWLLFVVVVSSLLFPLSLLFPTVSFLLKAFLLVIIFPSVAVAFRRYQDSKMSSQWRARLEIYSVNNSARFA